LNLLTFWSCIIWTYTCCVYLYFTINQFFTATDRHHNRSSFVRFYLRAIKRCNSWKQNWLKTRQCMSRKTLCFVSLLIHSIMYICIIMISSKRQSLIDWIYMYGLLFHYLGICNLLDRTQCLLKGSCLVEIGGLNIDQYKSYPLM